MAIDPRDIGPNPAPRSALRGPLGGVGVFLLLTLLAVAAAGCDSNDEPATRVGSIVIPDPLIDRLQQPERQMLFDLVAFGIAVAHQEIAALGAPGVQRTVDASRLDNLPYELAVGGMNLDERTLRAAYAEQPEWELSVRHVVRLVDAGAPRALRDSARSLAEEVAARARAGEDFAELAARFSEEPGAAERGGLLQPGRRGSWVDPFWRAALALRPGESGPVIETVYGFHVLYLEDRRPVPFEQADRGPLLRWVVTSGTAADAMQEWVGGPGAIAMNPEAARRTREFLIAGEPPPDSLVLATSGADDRFHAPDLVARSWTRLAPDGRTALESGSDSAFLAWVEAESRIALWAAQARRMHVSPAPQALRDAEADWQIRTARWSHAFGFSAGMSDEQVRHAAFDAVLSGSPAARAARQEIRSLRPLLRRSYPVVVSTP